VRELTVHHRDHNHDNNPPDGSNWELLCVYCHDTNTSGSWKRLAREAARSGRASTYTPFANLKELLAKKEPPK